MKTTTSERVALMLKELTVDQPELGKLAGASKSVVNQWLSGLIKKIGPKYAYAIEANTRYRKEWVMFGEGEKYKFTIDGESRRVEEIAPIPALTVPFQSARDRQINELVTLARSMSDEGLLRLLGVASENAKQYPAQAKQTPGSFQ